MIQNQQTLNNVRMVLERTQREVKAIYNREGFNPLEVDHETRKYFFLMFNTWFPAAKNKEGDEKKPQAIRHRIVQAFVGFPFTSMNQLPAQVWWKLGDVVADESENEYLDPSISLAISERLEGLTYGQPWDIDTWLEKAVEMSDMPKDDIPF